jgi:formylglycine-generating enzyme required for sulfatase activity
VLTYRKIGFLVLLITSDFSFWVAAPVYASAEQSENYLHLQEQCNHCHVDEKSFQAVLNTSLDECQNCHENGNTTTEMLLKSKTNVLQKVSSHQNEIREKGQPHQIINRGMRFPMFTMGSRLGDAPNQMVLIPEGKFLMGTDTRLPDEGPQHEIKLPDFYIDVYEVTNLQYKKFNDATNGRSPSHWRNRTFSKGKADHPVVFVTWDNANDYCDWAGKRLPTDKEWEKAARGIDGRTFPWGDVFSISKANTPLRWQEIGSIGDTTPVGSFEEGKSPYGLYDVSGNVWEWTDSWYMAYPGNKTKSESYGKRYKTLKGGSWFDCSFYKCGISAPVYNRAFFAKKVKNDSFGFRCAGDVAAEVTIPEPAILQ